MVKEPEGGWKNSQLSSIFVQTVPRKTPSTSFPSTVRSGTAGSSASTGAGGSTSSTSLGTFSTGAVVGVVFGSIAGLALFVSVAVILWRKARHRARQHESAANEIAQHGYKQELQRYPIIREHADSLPSELSGQLVITELPITH